MGGKITFPHLYPHLSIFVVTYCFKIHLSMSLFLGMLAMATLQHLQEMARPVTAWACLRKSASCFLVPTHTAITGRGVAGLRAGTRPWITFTQQL